MALLRAIGVIYYNKEYIAFLTSENKDLVRWLIRFPVRVVAAIRCDECSRIVGYKIIATDWWSIIGDILNSQFTSTDGRRCAECRTKYQVIISEFSPESVERQCKAA